MTKEMKEYLLEQREVNRKAWQAMKDLGNIRMMDIYDGKEKMINELLEKFDEESQHRIERQPLGLSLNEADGGRKPASNSERGRQI